MGARFMVGNGKNIKIWQHHWLPIKHPPLVSSPIIESMENATVDCLIDNSTGKWDDEMIKGVFIPAEAELVRKIPLPQTQIEDVLFWPFTGDGQYNCKSGYKFLKDLEENLEVSTPRRWIGKFGSASGAWKFQINIKTCCGVHVKTHYQQNIIWSGEP